METSGSVLVVEPDDDIAELECYHLQGLGLSVSRVASAEAALEYLHQQPSVDLLVLELVLPAASGQALIRELRALPDASRPRLLAATVLDAGDVVDQVDVVVAKPFRRADLVSAVATAMQCG